MSKASMGFASTKAKPLWKDTFIKASQAKTPLNRHFLSEIIPCPKKQSIMRNNKIYTLKPRENKTVQTIL